MNNSSKAAVVVIQGSAGLFLFITYLHQFTPWLPNKQCSRSSVEISALFSYSHIEEKKKFFMEPRILLFPRLAFLYIVLPLEKKTQCCVSAMSNSLFLVVVKQRLVIQFVDCWMYGSRKQVLTCSAQTLDKDNSVRTLGISTNKCDVYFLNACCL